MNVKEALSQPVGYRYPSGERPTEPPTDQEAFDPSDEWENYGDVNPEIHGGRFVRWDGDHFEIVVTTHESVLSEDMLSGEETHLIEDFALYPEDIWANPDDPLTDYTDGMKWVLGQFQNAPIHPNGREFLENVAYYAVDLHHYAHYNARDSYTDDYWGHLERKFGITPDEF